MEDNFKKRILRFLKHLQIGQTKFETNCNMGRGCIANLKDGFGATNLEKIMKRYPELSMEWLIAGSGDMLKTSIVNTGGISGGISISGSNKGDFSHSGNVENGNGFKTETTRGDKHQVNNFYTDLTKDEMYRIMHGNAHGYAEDTRKQIEICKQTQEMLTDVIAQNKSLIEQNKMLTDALLKEKMK